MTANTLDLVEMIGRHVQGWNKFCFTEGFFEISTKFPGAGSQPGLWPAAWIFGNLGRATVLNTTEKLWPWSYDHCPADEDNEANQDVPNQQRINACQGPEETAKYGLNPYQVCVP